MKEQINEMNDKWNVIPIILSKNNMSKRECPDLSINCKVKRIVALIQRWLDTHWAALFYGRGNQPIGRAYFLVSMSRLLKNHRLYCFAVPLPNPCNSQPCANGGTCSFDPIKNEYRCSCLGKFTGKNCEGIQLKYAYLNPRASSLVS